VNKVEETFLVIRFGGL